MARFESDRKENEALSFYRQCVGEIDHINPSAFLNAIDDFLPEFIEMYFQTCEEVDHLLGKVDELESRLERYEGKSNAIESLAARDKWIYEAVCDSSRGIDSIKFELRKLCDQRNWPNTISTPQGVVAAAKRHAKRFGFDPPPSRRTKQT